MVGSCAQSHVYVQYPPLGFEPPGAAGVMYDDGNKAILLPSQDKIVAYPIGQIALGTSSIKHGPVLGVRFSLDGKILCVQRSKHEVEFINRSSGKEWRQRCKRGAERILGFFWTDCPVCDFVLVTSGGLEIYAMMRGRDGLRLVKFQKSIVNWYVYTHESRMVILAAGMQCESLLAYQFSAGGLVRLPKFEVSLGSTDVNRKPVLEADDVKIATMYGRIYCVVIDRASMKLHMYRFYRDAVVPQNSLPIFSSNVAVSVVDNALVVHQVDAKVVLVYDVLSGSMHPVASPLPLTIRGIPQGGWGGGQGVGAHQEGEGVPGEASTSAGQGSGNGGDEDVREVEIDFDPDRNRGGRRGGRSQNVKSPIGEAYGPGWIFLNPDLVIDRFNGVLWRLQLDLEAFAASCSDAHSLLSFLQRRRVDPSKAKLLSLIVLRSTIVERAPLPTIASAMDILTVSFQSLLRVTGSRSSGSQERSGSPSSSFSGSRVPGRGGALSTVSLNPRVAPSSYIPLHNAPGLGSSAPGRFDARNDTRQGVRKMGGHVAKLGVHPVGAHEAPEASPSSATVVMNRIEEFGVSLPADKGQRYWRRESADPVMPREQEESEIGQIASDVFLEGMDLGEVDDSGEMMRAAQRGGKEGPSSKEPCGDEGSHGSSRGKEKLADDGLAVLENEGGRGGVGGDVWKLGLITAHDRVQGEVAAARSLGEIVAEDESSVMEGRGMRRHMQQPQSGVVVSESTSSSEWQVLKSISPAVSPEEMTSVLITIEEEMVVDASFLIAVALEYVRSAAAVGLRVPPKLHSWIALLLLREDKIHVLQQYINNGILEPSVSLALQILGTDAAEMDISESDPVLRKIGLEMLRHLSAHKEYIKGLLGDGELLQALRYMRKHQVEGLPPGVFLDMATASEDARVLAAVLRFFIEFVPNFESSADCSIYSKILHQHSSTAVARSLLNQMSAHARNHHHPAFTIA